MNPGYYEDNPFRSPTWRAERVWALLTAWPLPLGLRYYDDEYVRKYRNLLVARLSAGDDAAALAIIPSRLQVWKAHELYFQADHPQAAARSKPPD